MFLNWSFPTFRSTTFIYFHISLQRDDHSCWKFWLWSFKGIWCGAFQIANGLFGHLRLGFRFQERSAFSLILRVNQFFVDLGSWSDLLDALVSWWIFSNNRGRWFRSRPVIFLNFLGSFDFFGRFCLPLCLCIILTWNPIDYHIYRLLLVVHQRIRCFSGSSLWL